MKKLLFALLLLPLLPSCNKKHNEVQTTGPQLVMLKVDFITHQFEGGKIIRFPAGTGVPGSIPVRTIYKSPGDFGNITFQYIPTNDTLFDASIVWMGKGAIRHPVFDPASAYPTSGTTLPAPDSNRVQQFYPDQYTPGIPDTMIKRAWTGIAKLDITRQMRNSGARTALYLYRASVGVGDPADADFIWMLYID